MRHTPDKYLDKNIFIMFCTCKTISKLLFELILLVSVVKFDEGADEQTANDIFVYVIVL